MMTVKALFWLPYCSTCIKAQQFLLDRGVKIQKTVDIKAEPLSKEQIKELTTLIGSVEALFSKRAMKYRALGLDKKQLTDAEMLDYMHQEYTFIKRPVLVTNTGKILAGFSAKQYALLIDS
ncbi:MAG: arsenate reductase family protein [Cyanobacteria bacterium]|nr:arsenate reductase family protein [Cyanobacteriota bacterium]